MYICNNLWTVGVFNLTYFNSLPADHIPSTVLTQSAKLLLDLLINHNKIRSYIKCPPIC